jgi:hypothetical protein
MRKHGHIYLNKWLDMTKKQKLFISYSHFDEHALQRFVKHIAMLKRDGLISEWFDQKILAGGDIDDEISRHLEECHLFIPLMSADFLASNYCYEREMKRALERHDAGTMRVVPVIIQACEWKASPLKKLKALPKDGKPVSDWTNENNAWLDVVTHLRDVIIQLAPVPHNESRILARSKTEGASKYRVKRDFDEVDKQEFRQAAFSSMRQYFAAATKEIGEVENIKSRFAMMGDDGFTCTIVNRARERGVAHISIYSNSGRLSFGDITYSFAELAERSSVNGWFEIVADEYELFLTQNGMLHRNDREKITPEQAASELWDELLEKAGISYA